MKILITGSGGMVGYNLKCELTKYQHTVFAPPRAELDLRNQYATENYLRRTIPDLVIHCAGKVGGIQANLNDPVGFLVENTQISLSLFGAMEKVGIPLLLNLGSSCMYPAGCDNAIPEESILSGKLEKTNEGYALAKVLASKYCEYLTESRNLEYKTIIPCNLFGEYDSFDDNRSHLLPAIIKKIYRAKLEQRETVDVWGDGESKREFMYIKNLTEFLIFAIDKVDKLPQNLNVGMGKDHSINEYYAMVSQAIGYYPRLNHLLDKPVGMKRKLVDINKQKNLGWTPPYSLEYGIEKTLLFYTENVKS